MIAPPDDASTEDEKDSTHGALAEIVSKILSRTATTREGLAVQAAAGAPARDRPPVHALGLLFMRPSQIRSQQRLPPKAARR